MKKTLIAIAAMTLATTAGAQDTQQEAPKNTAHYITLDIGGGFNNLVYSLGDQGKREPGMGMTARLGYRYFFTPHWGVGINGVYKKSNTEAKINGYDEYANLTDQDGDNYSYYVRYNSLKERQKQTSIAIPVGLYFQCNMTEKWKLGFGLGVSAQFVNDESMETVKGDLSTEAYYSKDDIWFRNMENHGFYTKKDLKGSYDYKAAFGAYGELNSMYALARWVDVNFSIYGGYGLTKSTESSGKYVYDYNATRYNGALDSKITDGSHPLAIGAMAGFRFKIGKNKTESKPKDDDVKQAVVVDNKPEDPKKDENKQPEVKPDEQQQIAENKPEDPKKDENVQPENGQVVNITDIIGINTGNKPADKKDTKPADNQQTAKPVEPKKDDNKVYTEKGKEVYINGSRYVVVDTIRMIINFDLGASGDPNIKIVDQTLDDVAKYMKDHPDYLLSIVGHTCNLGSEATNNRIGLERANTIKKMFINRGIESSRLLTSTKADKQPLVPNTSDQNRSRNRRVELEYVK